MSTSSRQLVLESIEAPPPWNCFLCKARFPLAKSDRSAMAAFWRQLSVEARAQFTLQQCLLLQVQQLHVDGGSDVLMEHGARWLPEMGLGIWPDRDPPRQFTKATFYSYPPGYDRPVLIFQLFRLAGKEQHKEEAREIMLGRGTVLEILSPLAEDQLLANGQATLLPAIEDPAFRSFPFYLPLFSGATFKGGTAGQIEQWSCGATVYIRESVEDGGVFIASREPLEPVYEKLGGTLDSGTGTWSIPTATGE